MSWSKVSVVSAMAALLSTAAAWGAEYKIDPVHSGIVFGVNHLGAGNVYGMISDVSGTIHFDQENPANNSIEVVANVESLSTFEGRRDNHLKSPDFFSVKEFPTMSFKSDSWKKTDDDTYEVSGELTLHGVTKRITVTVNHLGFGQNRGRTLAGFETRFRINRTEFGMNYGVAEQGGLGKEVEVIVALESIEQG